MVLNHFNYMNEKLGPQQEARPLQGQIGLDILSLILFKVL